ncbi:hypothetical protein EPUS_03937 [Endocarpon pusillum Z07020]|uniref:Ricin B lectin domain-containing protein n=1 Tax=Endocarpon pusillum (strain Z07020 / HMAS-L-300199) TaxID=1263415 RepID=U1HYC0_ENDPU|nr:uncharacterized protein EPUS_03937 [Endocarpon pusillum Z07020]ERF74499.1 hypothetical protein EPUS_03937 [Endocarpon pusillum Z07020]
MHISKTLLPSLLGLCLSTNAACLQTQESGWHGPGFYGLRSRATGTVIDLYLGGAADGTPIVGWNSKGWNDHQTWLVAQVDNNEYVILNNGTGTAISANEAPNGVTSKKFCQLDGSIRWIGTIETVNGVDYATFESVEYPGNVLDLQGNGAENKVPIITYPKMVIGTSSGSL